jgi:hypothetical protein
MSPIPDYESGAERGTELLADDLSDWARTFCDRRRSAKPGLEMPLFYIAAGIDKTNPGLDLPGIVL